MTRRGLSPGRAAAAAFHDVICNSCRYDQDSPKCTQFRRFAKYATAVLAAPTPEAVAAQVHRATCDECFEAVAHPQLNRRLNASGEPADQDWHIAYLASAPMGRAMWWLNSRSVTDISPGDALGWLREVTAGARGRNDVPFGVPDPVEP